MPLHTIYLSLLVDPSNAHHPQFMKDLNHRSIFYQTNSDILYYFFLRLSPDLSVCEPSSIPETQYCHLLYITLSCHGHYSSVQCRLPLILPTETKKTPRGLPGTQNTPRATLLHSEGTQSSEAIASVTVQNMSCFSHSRGGCRWSVRYCTMAI
jgi:hypothetical protein